MLLSIVIPTKNRSATLYHAVRAGLALSSTDVEVIVQDCSDDDKTRATLAPFAADSRLRYSRSSGAPSMTENWNNAFESVRGEYAIVLGDDDAVGPEILNAARWASGNGVDAIADDRLAYFWPDYQLREIAGTVRVRRHTGQLTYADAISSLQDVLRGYPIDPQPLPHIYHGLVRTRLMHEIKRRAGSFFASMAPDFYSTVALSCLAQRFVRTAYPLCVSGASASANAGRVHQKRDHLHALEYGDRVDWSPYVPASYSMPAVILDATIKALTDMRRVGLISMLDFPSFYADCLVQQRTSVRAVATAMRHLLREYPPLRGSLTPALLARAMQMAARQVRALAGRAAPARALKKLKRRIVRFDYEVLSASNIVEALERSHDLLAARGVRSPFCPSDHRDHAEPV